MSSGPPAGGPPPSTEDDRPPQRRSRSRSPPRARGRRKSRSPSRSRSRSRSPPGFRGGRRSRSPLGRRGGPRGARGRSRSRSWSGSRSPSPRGGRLDRNRDFRGGGFRDRGPPPGPGGYGPPDDSRGDFHGRGRGPPPFRDPHFDRYGPGGGGPYGPPGRRPPPPPRRVERRRRDEGPPGVSLLVRNVAPTITTEDLQMAFGRIGDVRDVYIPRDYHSQQPKGFAFIEYANPDMAREARDEMDRFKIKGRELEVVFAQERRKTPNEMRGRSGSNPRGGGPAEFERSSSFERHRQRQREGGRDRDRDRDRDRRRDNGDRREAEPPRPPPGDGQDEDGKPVDSHAI